MDTITAIKRESFKFSKAVEYIKIKEDWNDDEVYKYVIQKQKPDKTGNSTLNKLKNACNNEENARWASMRSLQRVLNIIVPHLFEMYGAKWHDDEDDFLNEQEFDAIESRSFSKEWLDDLKGEWVGYSYNKDNSTKEEPAINIFKFEIQNHKNIICYTSAGTFEKGKMARIRHDCIEIELKSKERKLILFGLVGGVTKDILATKRKIVFTYIDTGNSRLKVGIAFILRVTVPEEEINPEIKQLSSFTDVKIIELIKHHLLDNSQLILNL